MINLLPHEIKQDRKYGRLNRFLAKQLVGFAVIGVLAVGFMLSGLQFIKNDEDLIKETIAAKEAEYEPLKIYEDEAKSLNESVATIQKLFDRELRFSELLVQIAQAIPTSARLTSLSLIGGSEEPLTITAIVDSQAGAGVLRKSLVDSPTFETADILNISDGETDDNGRVLDYNVTITTKLIQEPEVTEEEAEGETTSEQPTGEESSNASEAEEN